MVSHIDTRGSRFFAKMAGMPAAENRLIIAVDYGTTCTGVFCYLLSFMSTIAYSSQVLPGMYRRITTMRWILKRYPY